MTKTLNQIFFFLHQNQNIFFSNIGNQNIFLEKNHNPPLKLNGRSLSTLILFEWIRFSMFLNIERFVKMLFYFSCDIRTNFVGSSLKTECLENGIWSHPPPLCLGKYLIWFIVFNATFNNISAISWRPVLVVEEAGENHRPWATNW